MVMRRSVFWAASVAFVALAVAALRCNSVIGNSALTTESCTANCGPCTAYCNAVMQSCPRQGTNAAPALGPLTEYLTTDICLNTCSVNSIGTPASTPNWFQLVSEEETAFACRQGQTGDAGTSTSCANAGPLGGATCVTPGTAVPDPCKTFCLLDLQICTGANQQYDSEADCEQYCGTRAQQGFYVPAGGGASDLSTHQGDDTLNCRFYHLENAMVSQVAPFGPDIHCIHTGKAGGGVCIPSVTDAGEDATGE
jgi:hypothetical protein